MSTEKRYKLYRGMRTGRKDFLLEKAIITGADGDHQKAGLGLHVTADTRTAMHYATFGSIAPRLLQDRLSRFLQNVHDAFTGENAPRKGRPMILEFDVALDGKDWRLDSEWEVAETTSLVESIGAILPLASRGDFQKAMDDYNVPRAFDLAQRTAPEQFAKLNLKALMAALERCPKDGQGRLRYIGKDPLPVNRIFVLNEESKEFELVYDRSQPAPRQPVKTALKVQP